MAGNWECIYVLYVPHTTITINAINVKCDTKTRNNQQKYETFQNQFISKF